MPSVFQMYCYYIFSLVSILSLNFDSAKRATPLQELLIKTIAFNVAVCLMYCIVLLHVMCSSDQEPLAICGLRDQFDKDTETPVY